MELGSDDSHITFPCAIFLTNKRQIELTIKVGSIANGIYWQLIYGLLVQ